MHRHDGRLGDAEYVEGEQHPQGDRRHLAGEDAAGVEVERAGGDAGPGDGRQQQQGRGAEQHQEIEAPGPLGLLVAAVGDQRIGDQRQHLVEKEGGEQVAGERKAHGGGDREREADVEDRLPLFAVRPHVADRIQRIDDPQARRDGREERAQRLDVKGDRQAGQHVDEMQRRPLAGKHLGGERQDGGEQDHGAQHGGALAQVRPLVEQGDQNGRRRRHDQRQGDQLGAAHGVPPMSSVAALPAMPAVSPVSRPK